MPSLLPTKNPVTATFNPTNSPLSYTYGPAADPTFAPTTLAPSITPTIQPPTLHSGSVACLDEPKCVYPNLLINQITNLQLIAIEI